MDIHSCIHAYVWEHKHEILDTLKELVSIPSVHGNATDDTPFGSECARTLDMVNQLYRQNGFSTDLHQESGYLLSTYGEGTRTLGLFSHADVVPVNNDWVYTDPFIPVEKDGYLIGRGVLDDKSAIVATLYCAKMLKELDIPFHSRLVCFTGANEESGMADIHNYLKEQTAPDFALVCDTAFPVYCGNKGIFRFEAVSQTPLEKVLDFHGGNCFNIILGNALAHIRFDDGLYTELVQKQTDRVRVEKQDDIIVLHAEGISKHGALPDGSLNAGWLLANILADCETLCEHDRKQMRIIRHLLSSNYGESFGICADDTTFGALTCTNGMVRVKNGKVSLCFDTRFGTSANLDTLKEAVTQVLNRHGWSVKSVKSIPPHLTDKDNPYVQACLNTYRQYTGDSEAQAHINAGGTYAMLLPYAAEIGTTLTWGCPSGMPTGHGGAHQSDECIHIEGFLNAMELTMRMLIECDKLTA